MPSQIQNATKSSLETLDQNWENKGSVKLKPKLKRRAHWLGQRNENGNNK